MTDEKEEEQEHLDELLNEFLMRVWKLKQKAKQIQDDDSITKKIIRWINSK